MCYKGEICGFDYEKQKDGTFLYKAKENSLSSSQKKIAKPQYKEKPEYPVIEQYEQKAIERYRIDLSNVAKEIVQFLKNI